MVTEIAPKLHRMPINAPVTDKTIYLYIKLYKHTFKSLVCVYVGSCTQQCSVHLNQNTQKGTNKKLVPNVWKCLLKEKERKMALTENP